jgi:SAM-dependent methyltransferase
LIDPRSAGFGSRAREYESSRPSYPAAALDHATAALGLERGATVVDLAAGTGKLTRLLTERFERVIAIEPSARMRAVLEEVVPAAEARVGTAEDTGLGNTSVDAVFVGEAFHWFDEVPAIREFHRVLRPDGGLVLLWNLERWDGQKYPWLTRFGELVGGHRKLDYPGQRGGWVPSPAVADLFEAPTQAGFEQTHRLDVDGFIAMISSWSWMAALDDERRDEALYSVRELLANRDEVALDYETTVVSARVASPGPRQSLDS